MTLNNRVVLITGGKRIGQVVARELASRGADVAVSYRGSKEEADETVSEVRGLGRRAIAVGADVGQVKDCEALVEAVVSELGRLDVLVNLASIYGAVDFAATTPEIWQRNVDVNLRSVFLCARAAVPHMRRQGGGRIVNFSDWIAKSGRPRYNGYLPYYVAKAGAIALTEALALELAPYDILVNAVAPGPILAPPGTGDDEMRAVEQATPLGRWGGEIEISKGVLALLESDFITGETIRIDGGRHVK